MTPKHFSLPLLIRKSFPYVSYRIFNNKKNNLDTAPLHEIYITNVVHVLSFASQIKPTPLPRDWDAWEKPARDTFKHKGNVSYLSTVQRS